MKSQTKGIPHTSDSFGSADRPLRRYITISKALDRILEGARQSGVDGLPLRKQLIRTWSFYVLKTLRADGIAIFYEERGRPPFNWRSGRVDDALVRDVGAAGHIVDHPTFSDVAKRLVVTQEVPSVSGRLTVGILHSRRWRVSDIGWTADSLDLLQGVITRTRRRELDTIAYRITDRQTMLKELRPNSLYYNLLHAMAHIARHDESSTLITCRSAETVIVAEAIHSSKEKSQRVGSRLPIVCWDVNPGVITAGEDAPDSLRDLCEAVYGARWGADVRSSLAFPLHAPNEADHLVVVLADSRSGFFTLSDLGAVGHVAARATHIIGNSVEFSRRLESRRRQLDELILRSHSNLELLHRAVSWMRTTFAAAAAQIVLADGSRFWEADDLSEPPDLTPAFREHVEKGGGVYYARTSSDRGYEATVAAPLPHLDREGGIVACHYRTSRRPSPIEQLLLEAASHQIASALELRTLSDRQLADLRRVLRLMEIVAAAETDTNLLDSLTDEVKGLLATEYCFVSIPDAITGTLRVHARTWRDEFEVPPIDITGEIGEGITGLVASEKRIYRTGNVATDPYYRDVVAGKSSIQIRSEMAGPLIFEDKVLGVIDLLSSRRDAFSDQDETLLGMLLTHSSIALAHAQRARHAREHAVVIDDLHARLLKLTDPGEIYDVVLETALAFVRSLHPRHDIFGNLYVKRPRLNFLEAKAFIGPKGSKYSPTQYFNEGVVGTVAATGEAITIDDTSAPPKGIKYEPFIQGTAHGSEIAVPIHTGKDVDAVINLESPEPAMFGQLDLEALQAIASEISLAVRFAQLNESARLGQQRQVAARQLQFLLNLSHEVGKSARATSAVMPELKAMLADRPESLRLIEKARVQAHRAIAIEQRLMESFAGTQSTDVATDIVNGVTQALDLVKPPQDVQVDVRLKTQTFEVNGSLDSITMVFVNLLDNAIAAMLNSELRVVTIAEHDVDDPDTLVIDVSDTGHGIPPEKKDEIWKPYFTDDGTGKKKGLGIGLSLVMEHIERMGGSIDLHASEPGRGSTFRLTFAARPGE